MMSEDDNKGGGSPGGSLLSEQQVRRLKVAVVVMSALLLAGIVTLIGRIIYLASNRGEATAVAAGSGMVLKPEAAVSLPSGHDVKAVGMSGNRMFVHHVGPQGDGVQILDLATGQVVSRVMIRRSP